jgi:dihydrofolate reductase
MSNNIEVVQIVARSSNNVIGNGDEIPWKIVGDLQYFKENTLNHVCIVGRKTYETIKHLKGRKFIVLSRNGVTRVEDGVIYARDIDTAIAMAKINTFLNNKTRVLIIGGAEIYRLSMEVSQRLLVTEVDIEVDGDATYEIPDCFKLVNESEAIHEGEYSYKFTEYERIPK